MSHDFAFFLQCLRRSIATESGFVEGEDGWLHVGLCGVA